MIGFAPKSPEYNTAGYGEPGHYFTLRAMGTRVKVTFPCGSAVFDGPQDAEGFLGHPGDIGHAAAFYLDGLRAAA